MQFLKMHFHVEGSIIFSVVFAYVCLFLCQLRDAVSILVFFMCPSVCATVLKIWFSSHEEKINEKHAVLQVTFAIHIDFEALREVFPSKEQPT